MMKSESAKKRNVDLNDDLALENMYFARVWSVEEEDPIRRTRAQNRVGTQTRSSVCAHAHGDSRFFGPPPPQKARPEKHESQ